MKPLRRLAPVLLLAVSCQNSVIRPEPYVLEPQVDPGRASVLAKAGVLRPNDLKGWTSVKPETAGPEAEAAVSDFERCLGEKTAPVHVAEQEAEFTRGQVELSSGATVAQTPAQAEKELAAFRNPDFEKCFEEMLLDEIPLPQGVKIGNVSVTPVTVTVPDAETYGFSIQVPMTGPAKSIKLTMVTLMARVGPTIVGIDAHATDVAPPDTASLTRLLSTAVKRVTAVPDK